MAQPKAYERLEHEHLYLKLDPASVAAYIAKPKKADEKLKITFDKEQGERTPLFFQYLILSEIRPGHLLNSTRIYRMYRFYKSSSVRSWTLIKKILDGNLISVMENEYGIELYAQSASER